jgi:23S rRNA (uracil1939-C5)-methyltransferase
VRLTLQIEALSPGGEGMGRADDRPVFVPFTAPGDLVTVEVAPGEGAVHAERLELLSPGPARQEVACPHFGPEGDRCGGCEWLHVTPLTQLSAKARALRETLRRIGRLDPAALRWLPPIASPEPLRYRSRAKLHLDRRAGRLVFFRRRSHEAVPLVECLLLRPGLERLRAALGPALAAADLAPREVWLEWSDHQGRGAACLDLAAVGERERRRAEALLGQVPGLAGLVLRPPEGSPALLGQPVLLQARDPDDPAAGLCRSRPDVFQQANRAANARLVRSALELLAPRGEEVLELHCGAGNFTGPLSSLARSVAAVEVQGPALELARADLAAAPVRFFSGDALSMARAFAREQRPKAVEHGPAACRFDAVLLDPPREGARGLGPALRDLGVARAVYVSCDPATLARDLKGCVECGFTVEAVQAVDLFPQTHHVEAVALLVAPRR